MSEHVLQLFPWSIVQINCCSTHEMNWVFGGRWPQLYTYIHKNTYVHVCSGNDFCIARKMLVVGTPNKHSFIINTKTPIRRLKSHQIFPIAIKILWNLLGNTLARWLPSAVTHLEPLKSLMNGRASDVVLAHKRNN